MAWEDVTYENESAKFHADDNKDRHTVVQSWAGLDRGVLEKALRDWWNSDPGTCFCKHPGKHPEPVIVPEVHEEPTFGSGYVTEI